MSERPGERAGDRETTYDDRLDDVRAPQWEEAVAASAAAGAIVPADAPPLASDDVTNNLRRYARWQWRDYWQRRGFWLAGAALFGVWLLTRMAAVGGPHNGPMQAVNVTLLAHALFALGGGVAGLVGVGGVVARERERGLQRFLFAKPVGIARYYLQGLVVHGVGSLLVLLGAVLLAALVLAPVVPALTVFGAAAAGYVLASGVTFLASTLLRFDAALAGGWLLAGFPVVAFAENGYWWAQALRWLFPQGWMLAIGKVWLPQGPAGPVITPEVAIVLALCALVAVVYGAAAYVAGVAVLRRRSIQT